VTDAKATGVEFLRDGVPHVAQARGEVVVCGGVYGSPQLLQLSGLGPAAHLRGFGIPVVRDMPGVGADLQDHFYVRTAFRCTQPITLNDVANSPVRKLLAGIQYVFLHKGPLTMGTDPHAVCDPRLRVNGIGRLRVVDAAVMPSVPAGNTNAPTIMIAEKAAEMILDDGRAA